MRSGHLRIVVSTLTRNRPIMLAALLDAWKSITLPENCEVQFLVVENNQTPDAEHIVAQYATNGLKVTYKLQSELGIPFARNMAAEHAIQRGADLLVFIDDDEVPADDWLVNLINGYRTSKATLLGAPLRANPPEQKLGWWKELLFKNVQNRYRRKEKYAAAKASLNATPRVTIVTNNWLAELTLFTKHNLWFDESLRFTGGEDTAFYKAVRDLDLPTGWVKDALVYETIDSERLSFNYQMARGRDQANSKIRRNLKASPRHLFIYAALAVAKTVSAVPLAAVSVVLPTRTLLTLARTIGWVWGWFSVLLGVRSNLYAKTEGH